MQGTGEEGILGERHSMNKSQGRQTRRPMGKAGCTVWALEALERFLSHVAQEESVGRTP